MNTKNTKLTYKISELYGNEVVMPHLEAVSQFP
jgi:hypothetical protein